MSEVMGYVIALQRLASQLNFRLETSGSRLEVLRTLSEVSVDRFGDSVRLEVPARHCRNLV